MSDLIFPEINQVRVAGNLTKDPVFNITKNGSSVINFHIAVNRSFRKSNNEKKEDVCFVGVVAWNQLAESCRSFLHKGDAVLIDGVLQSNTFRDESDLNLTIVEIKAKKIQFLTKKYEASSAEFLNSDVEKKVSDKDFI